MNTAIRYARHTNKGYSLIELLIAMTLGLMVLAGVLKVFSDNNRVYSIIDARSKMQENARYALYAISRDMRMAGYMFCNADAQIANTVNSTDWIFWKGAVSGYEGGSSVFPSEFSANLYTAPNAPINSDSIIIRRADSDNTISISSHDANAATIHFAEDQAIEKGAVYVIANPLCTQLGIFQASDPSTAGLHNHVVHNTGGSSSPGNCTAQLGGRFSCAPTVQNSTCNPSVTAIPAGESCKYNYPPGSKVFKLLTHAYYIGLSQNIPTLFTEKLTESGGNASTTKNIVVQGVESLQMLYGIDTDTDGIANQYVTADNIAGNDVVSLRIDLLMRSTNQVMGSQQKYVYQNNTVTSSDNFLRKEFSTTIKLRNQGLL